MMARRAVVSDRTIFFFSHGEKMKTAFPLHVRERKKKIRNVPTNSKRRRNSSSNETLHFEEKQPKQKIIEIFFFKNPSPFTFFFCLPFRSNLLRFARLRKLLDRYSYLGYLKLDP